MGNCVFLFLCFLLVISDLSTVFSCTCLYFCSENICSIFYKQITFLKSFALINSSNNYMATGSNSAVARPDNRDD